MAQLLSHGERVDERLPLHLFVKELVLHMVIHNNSVQVDGQDGRHWDEHLVEDEVVEENNVEGVMCFEPENHNFVIKLVVQGEVACTMHESEDEENDNRGRD